MSREGGGRTSIGCPDRGYFEFPSCGGGAWIFSGTTHCTFGLLHEMHKFLPNFFLTNTGKSGWLNKIYTKSNWKWQVGLAMYFTVLLVK